MKLPNKDRSVYLIICVIIAMACLYGCGKHRNTAATLHSNWVSSNPLSIPYRVRIQKKDAGNLLINADFEQGRFFYFDSLSQATFDINGWKKVGNKVLWVDAKQKNLFDSSEVASGNHAVKIHRSLANETEDTGEGVISDFIKVIPGNYQLSLDIKLKDVHSHKARLGTKIYNSIDVRIIYYDKNKLEINSNIYSPHYQTNINTSFKGYPFSNFWSIDSMNWTRVFCKTANYPFPEGNIPDETRFLKIFIGFKGEGTMWVDNIDLRYTDYNFTVQELTKLYVNKTFSDLELLLPTPQKIEKLSTVRITDSSSITIVASRPFMAFADSLAIKLSKICPTYIAMSNQKKKWDHNNTIVINLGQTSVFSDYQDYLNTTWINNQKKGAYQIQSIPAESPMVFLLAKSQEGMYYAYMRLTQLIDTNQKIIHFANIEDWPSFQQRGFILTDTLSSIKPVLSECFTNTRVLPNKKAGKYESPPFVKSGKINELFPENNEKFQFNRFITFDFDLSENEEHYNPYLPLERNKQNTRNALLNHSHLISYNNWNNAEFLDMYFDKFDSYYRYNDLFYSRSLVYSWTGAAEVSYYIDETSYLRYKNYVKGPVQFIDNTLSVNRPHCTGYTSNFLVPVYRVNFSDAMLDTLQNSILFHWNDQTPFSYISALTASDFAWNPEYYNPWLSLFKALTINYGKQNAASLLHFNDVYFKIYRSLHSLNLEQLNNRVLKILEEQFLTLENILNEMDMPEEELLYLQKLNRELNKEKQMLVSNTKFQYK